MRSYPCVVYRSTVVLSWLLAVTGGLAAWVWNARSQCDELSTPLGVQFALVASVAAIALGLIASALPLSAIRVSWRVWAGLAVIVGVAALYFALAATPAGGCG